MIQQLGLMGLLVLLSTFLSAQTLDQQIHTFEQELRALKVRQSQLLDSLEGLKLARIRHDLHEVGLPAIEPGGTASRARCDDAGL